MAISRKLSTDVSAYALILDPDEAGYLQELLYAHCAGALLNYGEPLGRILEALAELRPPHRTIRNLNNDAPDNSRRVYTVAYADNDPEVNSPEIRWWEDHHDTSFDDEEA